MVKDVEERKVVGAFVGDCVEERVDCCVMGRKEEGEVVKDGKFVWERKVVGIFVVGVFVVGVVVFKYKGHPEEQLQCP